MLPAVRWVLCGMLLCLSPWLGLAQVVPAGGGSSPLAATFPVTTCVNQVGVGLTSQGVLQCAPVTPALTIGLAASGVDVAPTGEVTATHLAAPLPFAQGGLGFNSATPGALLYFSGPNTPSVLPPFPQNAPLIGGGPGNPPLAGTRSGTTLEFATVLGSLVVGKQLTFDANGNIVASPFETGAAFVTSVFGRVGAVVGQPGDYAAADVTNAADKTAANDFTHAAGQTMTQLLLRGSLSGMLTLKAPANAATASFTLPGGSTDLSGSGGAGQVVKQIALGGALSVAPLNFTEVQGQATAAQVPTLPNLTGVLPASKGGLGWTDTTMSGTTHVLATVQGTLTSGFGLMADANGNIVTTGAPPGAGGGGSGTVNTGAAGMLGYYGAAGTTISDSGILAGQVVTAAAVFQSGRLVQAGGTNRTLVDSGILVTEVCKANTACAGFQASLGFTPEDVNNKSNAPTLGTSTSAYPTQNAVKTYVDNVLGSKQDTITWGAGLTIVGGVAQTASTEAGFLADGGATPLACGTSNQGRMQVLDNGDLQYCDGATTSVLRAGKPTQAGLTWNANLASCRSDANGGKLTIHPSLDEIICASDLGGGAGGVASVFGRTGVVSAQSGDYTAAQVTNAADKTQETIFTHPNGVSVRQLVLPGATSGSITVRAAATAGTTVVVLPGSSIDFTGTGGTGQVVRQNALGSGFSVSQLNFNELLGSAAAAQLPTLQNMNGVVPTSKGGLGWTDTLFTGTTHTLVTSQGGLGADQGVKSDAQGNLVSTGQPPGIGTVAASTTAGVLAVYATAGSVVSESTVLAANVVTASAVFPVSGRLIQSGTGRTITASAVLISSLCVADTPCSGYQASLGFTPEDVSHKNSSTSLSGSLGDYPTQAAVKAYVDTGLATKQGTVTWGAGLAFAAGTASVNSASNGFLTDGGATALTCGPSTQGRMQVMDNGDLQYCDGATTSLLRSGKPTQAGLTWNASLATCRTDSNGGKLTIHPTLDEIVCASDIAATGGPTGVTSVFGRTGVVVAAGGDYTAAQVTNAADLTAANVFTHATGQSMRQLLLPGGTSGTLTLKAAAIAGTSVLTFPSGTTDFSASGGSGHVVRQNSAQGAFTVGRLSFSDLDNSAVAGQVPNLENLNGLVPTTKGGLGWTDTTFTGNTHRLANASGALTPSMGLMADASGNVVTTGQPPGIGTITASGTPGVLAVYASAGSTVSESAIIAANVMTTSAVFPATGRVLQSGTGRTATATTILVTALCVADTACSGYQAALGFTPEDVARKNTSTALTGGAGDYPTQTAVKSYVDTGLTAKQDVITWGAGLAVTDAVARVDSLEQGFLTRGGTTPMTCGTNAQGRIQVMLNGDIQYCDDATTSVLRIGKLTQAGLSWNANLTSCRGDANGGKLTIHPTLDEIVCASDIVGSGGPGAVSSVFTRTGAVVAQTGDYTAAQVTNAADKTTFVTFEHASGISVKQLVIPGGTSGTLTLKAALTAGTSSITFPNGTTDFSLTGGVGHVVKQSLLGAPLTVGALSAAELSNGTTGTGAVVLATNPSIAALANLTQNGLVRTSGSNGTLGVDTSVYLTANQPITLTGDVAGGPAATSITVTVNKIHGVDFAGVSGNLVRFGAGNTPVDSLLPAAQVPTAAAIFTSGRLIQAAGNDRTLSDSGILVADVCKANTACAGYQAALGFTPVTNTTTVTITGTPNQISITGATTQTLNGNVSWGLSLPQNIDAGATVRHASLGLNQAASATAGQIAVLGTSGQTLLQLRLASGAASGNFDDYQNNAGTSLWRVDFNGILQAGTVPGARVSGNIAGNAATASAFDGNRAACPTDRYVNDQDANGNLLCVQVNLAGGVIGNLPAGNLGGGTGASATTLLHGNMTWAAINLGTAEVTGNLPVARTAGGGTATATQLWHGDGLWKAVDLATAEVTGLLPVARTAGGATATATQVWHGNGTWGPVALNTDTTGSLTSPQMPPIMSHSRVDPLVQTLTGTGPFTINSDTASLVVHAALTASATFNAPLPAGTAPNGRVIVVRLTSATSQTLSFPTTANAFSAGANMLLPTATTGSNIQDQFVFEWNSTTLKWVLIGSTVLTAPLDSAALHPKLRTKTCMIVLGAENGPVLTNADLGPQRDLCRASVQMTVKEIAVRADAGTPTVQIHRRDTIDTALHSGSITAGTCSRSAGDTAGIDGTTCTGPALTAGAIVVPAGQYLGVTAGVAGGTAKRVSVAITLIVD